MSVPQPVVATDFIIKVNGELINELPADLYIPPQALAVFLEAFEGPLDFLLYLIKKQNLDILDIPIAKVTEQYIQYIELMEQMEFELAAEYLVMAAMLAEIKSRMLLPRASVSADGEEIDPRAELVRRLQEYEQFKKAAIALDQLPQQGRDVFAASAQFDKGIIEKPLPTVQMDELVSAFREVLLRAKMYENHQITREPLSVRERMSHVLSLLTTQTFTPFNALFDIEEGRLGVVVTFLAILELLKSSLIELVQNEAFAPIHVKAA